MRIVYFHAPENFANYLNFIHFRQALSKIAEVYFYESPILSEGAPKPHDARELVKKHKADAVVVGVCNFVYRSMSNMDKVDVPKLMHSDDPHGFLPLKARWMNKAKVDAMLMMNIGEWHGKPEDYPSGWLNSQRGCTSGQMVIHGGRTTLADRYQKLLNYNPKFIFFPESVNLGFFRDRGYDRTCDVFNSGSFVGEVYPFRVHLYNVLRTISDIKCCINPSLGLSWEEYADRMARSKMLVEGIGVFGYTSQRFVQAMASKTLVVSSLPYDNIENHFIPDENCVEINRDNFLEKIRYYLENEADREKLIRNAYKTILQYHTCEIRAQQMVDVINDL